MAIDNIKVHVVIALCEELSGLDTTDARYQIVVDHLDNHWRVLSPMEQDEVDRVLVRRGLPTVQTGRASNGV